jgi:hypothetical protein
LRRRITSAKRTPAAGPNARHRRTHGVNCNDMLCVAPHGKPCPVLPPPSAAHFQTAISQQKLSRHVRGLTTSESAARPPKRTSLSKRHWLPSPTWAGFYGMRTERLPLALHQPTKGGRIRRHPGPAVSRAARVICDGLRKQSRPAGLAARPLPLSALRCGADRVEALP